MLQNRKFYFPMTLSEIGKITEEDAPREASKPDADFQPKDFLQKNFLRVNPKPESPRNYEESDLFYEFVNLIPLYPQRGWILQPVNYRLVG